MRPQKQQKKFFNDLKGENDHALLYTLNFYIKDGDYKGVINLEILG